MITNFDYLKKEAKFTVFADVAIAAERVILLDPEASILNSRRAMEFAIKWMYSVDKNLEVPYQDNLQSLMNAEDYRQAVGNDIWRRMDYIRRSGNNVAHGKKKLGRDEAMLCLENLFIYLDFIACCYSSHYVERIFDKEIINARIEKSKKSKANARKSKEEIEKSKEKIQKSKEEIEKSREEAQRFKEEIQKSREEAEKSREEARKSRQEIEKYKEEAEKALEKLMAENASLREKLSARRQEQQEKYVPKPLDLSEYKTRKLYIDSMLIDAGWTEGKDWINEVQLKGMPNKSGVGYADYVLYDDTHKPLAIVEAKRTCVDVSKGRQQAKLYADLLEQKYRRRPVIFLTNGFETHIIDGQYPERKCSFIYSKRDLEKWFNLLTMRTSLKNIVVNKDIAGRYYQEAAIKAVCNSFDMKNRRKALLVMATGSGKTRTVIALCDALLKAGWIKNILFLADRNSLVTQAKRSFVNLLPNLSCTNLVEEKNNYKAHCVFSTYQTMINCIDAVSDSDGKLFTCGHFDLVICDEAHRSIYNKYRDIFNYFDAPLVGLTATPKDEIDKNTYEIFELENGVPTYGYDLAQAVKDGYLVDYVSIESQLKVLEKGISYDDLTAEEKEIYENTFKDEKGELPKMMPASEINKRIFNEDTIRKVLDIVMTNGIKIDYGQKIGKTIIFAKNHDHAEKIFEIFNKEYPHLPNYARVIDNYMTYAQSAIDEFSDPKKMPQIAISVDMLDTGIDVPEVVNLVFFKKVMSKAKFWQMIGRGTRLCTGLLDGEDKKEFYIFDFCRNFEFFRMNKGREAANKIALQGAIFNLQFEIAYKLQEMEYQEERLMDYRKALVAHMSQKVKELPRENFAVRQHLKYIDLYALEANYENLTYEDTLLVKQEVAPLILPDRDEVTAIRFDALMYGIELAYLIGKKYTKARSDLQKSVSKIANIANIPEIQKQSDFIQKVLNTDYVEQAGINEFEEIREKLRSLMKYIKKEKIRYDTDFEDDLLAMEWNESELENDELKNYKAKAEYYIRQHQDHIVIAKLRTNRPLSKEDVKILEDILWSEVGTKQDYEAEIGAKPLGEFVREIVGLDMNAAKEAFSDYLTDVNLDSNQIYFVNQIIEYIVQNGMMKDLSVLQESPFNDRGSIVDIFTDLTVWAGIRNVIESINSNVAV